MRRASAQRARKRFGTGIEEGEPPFVPTTRSATAIGRKPDNRLAAVAADKFGAGAAKAGGERRHLDGRHDLATSQSVS